MCCSVFNGFRAVIAGRLDTLSPDVLVTPAKGKTIADGEETAARILAVEGVERATPTISDNALALYGGADAGTPQGESIRKHTPK